MKPITIDLKYRDSRISNLEELRRSCLENPAEIIQAYKDATLIRWFSCRGLESEVQHLGEISSGEDEVILAELRKVLKISGDINARDMDGWTRLHSAAYNGDLGKVESLILEGADVDAANERGTTPLRRAAFNGHANVAKLLIEKGAKVNALGIDGGTPLHVAAQNGHKDAAMVLIRGGADIKVKDNGGRSPFYVACANNRKEVVDLLIENGADLNEADDSGCTVLICAVVHAVEDDTMANLLIEKGADVHATFEGSTPLHAAANFGLNGIAEKLIKNGANINAIWEFNNVMVKPVDLAEHKGHADLVKILSKR